MMTFFVDFLSHRKPSLYIFFIEMDENKLSAKTLQDENNGYYLNCRKTVIS